MWSGAMNKKYCGYYKRISYYEKSMKEIISITDDRKMDYLELNGHYRDSWRWENSSMCRFASWIICSGTIISKMQQKISGEMEFWEKSFSVEKMS